MYSFKYSRRNTGISIFLCVFIVTYLLILFPSVVHKLTRSDVTANGISLDYDLCGVLHGDESTCYSLLKDIGIQKGTKNWRLRDILHEYVNIHKKIMDPEDNSIPKRYVVMADEPEAGLGNRFQVMVAIFLYAMLSKRALLIDWPEVKPIVHWNGVRINN
jgi:hypothetical protein